MQWLAELCVKRPVFATVLILSLTVVGAFSFIQLGVDRYPKVDIPTILITTVQPGAAPEQIETEVTDKIEQAVNTISGIDELRSTSSEGVSIVTVGFLLEKDGDIAAQEVRDKINGVLAQLPKTIEQPRVDRFDPDAAPVLSLALTSTGRFARSRNTPTRSSAVSSRAWRASARWWSSAAGSGRSTSGSTRIVCAHTT
jgi:HAE1 family hydrophobic/amphiphilic exporter-1